MSNAHVMPGGGPWRILAHCEAEKHNTYAAARGRHGQTVCSCPRAKAMMANERKRRREDRVPTSPLPGGGPWLILEGCAAPKHNTIRAVEGRAGYAKCICPRGRDLLENRQREWGRASRARRKEQIGLTLAAAMPEETEIRVPDLSAGACRRPSMRTYVDGGFNSYPSLAGEREREAAKSVCDVCPVMTLCREYVLAAEKPAGEWGGVWGGMDPWNRKGIKLTFDDNGMVRKERYELA